MKKLLAALMLLAPLPAHAQTVRLDLTDTAFTDAGPVSVAAPLSVSSYNFKIDPTAPYYDDNRFCYTVATSLPVPNAPCATHGGGQKGDEGLVVTSTGNLYLRAIGSGAAVNIIAVGAAGGGGGAPALAPNAATNSELVTQTGHLSSIDQALANPTLPPGASTEAKQDVGNAALVSMAANSANGATLSEQQTQTALQNTIAQQQVQDIAKHYAGGADPSPDFYRAVGGVYRATPYLLNDGEGTGFQTDDKANLKTTNQSVFTGGPLSLNPGDTAPAQVNSAGAAIVALSSESPIGTPSATAVTIQADPFAPLQVVSAGAPVGAGNAAVARVTVGTAAIALLPARIGTPGVGRKSANIVNNGPATIYIGFAAATTVANGYVLASGAGLTISTQTAIYAIAAAAGNGVSIIETW